MKIQTTIEVEIPPVPDRLKVAGSKRAGLLISELGEAELSRLGEEWTAALIKRAAVLRKGQPAEGEARAQA